MTPTTASPASFSPRKLRSRNAIPSGIAVSRVAEVVDQIRQKRHRPGRGEDHHLRKCSHAEHGETESHRLDAFTRANNRAIDQAV